MEDGDAKVVSFPPPAGWSTEEVTYFYEAMRWYDEHLTNDAAPPDNVVPFPSR